VKLNFASTPTDVACRAHFRTKSKKEDKQVGLEKPFQMDVVEGFSFKPICLRILRISININRKTIDSTKNFLWLIADFHGKMDS